MVQTLAKSGRGAEALAAWLETCERHLAERRRDEPDWLGARRREAVERLAAAGFPTRKHEAWRYTDVSSVVNAGHVPFVQGDLAEARRVLDAAPRLERAHRIVLVDGVFSPELSELPESSGPDGADAPYVGGLAALLASGPDRVRDVLGAVAGAESETDAFVELSTALFTDGAAVLVPDRAVLEAPVQVVFVATARERAVVRPVRLVVRAGRASQLSVVETFVGPDGAGGEAATSRGPGAGSATLAVTEIEAGAGAVVDRLRIQCEGDADAHLGVTRARLDRDATVSSRVLSLGARIARDDTSVLLAGEGATAELHGLYAPDGERHADCQTSVEHAAPHATSRQLYRGVLRDRSRGVFSGRVLVRTGAVGTDASQSNDNLILSKDARADTKPQLEILADDVQCRHGATIGELPEDEVFYLRTRGIGEADAREMIVRAFAAAAVEGARGEGERALVDELVGIAVAPADPAARRLGAAESEAKEERT